MSASGFSPPLTGRAPTMADVAKRAAVSPQTVSRVVRGQTNVSEVTRLKVELAIDELGYRRTGIARALVTGHTMTLGVLTQGSVAYSRAAYVAAMTSAARRHGYYVAAASVTSTVPEAVCQSIEHLRQQGVDGIVVAVPVYDVDALAQAARGLPAVVFGGSSSEAVPDGFSDGTGHHAVCIDQERIGVLATEHLLGLGHDTVWHVAGPSTWADASGRQAGWAATLAKHGRPEPPVLIGDWSAESGWRLGTLLARMEEVTAIFAASDDMAFGILRALVDRGRRVPEDVSVVGADDVPLAAFAPVALTTVRQSFQDLGTAAIDLLVDMVERPDREHHGVLMEPELVLRSSTAPRHAG